MKAKTALLVTSALCGAVLVGAGGPVWAQFASGDGSGGGSSITTTTTTVYSYDFPDQTEPTSTTTTTSTSGSCPATYNYGNVEGGPTDNDLDGNYDAGAPFSVDPNDTDSGWTNGNTPSGDSDADAGGGGYSCMVVTHFYRRGLFSKKEWLVNKRDALSGRLTMQTLYGYHVWAPYAVLAMRRSAMIEHLFFRLFSMRNNVLEFYQGRRAQASFADNLARLALEMPSVALGFLGIKPDHNFNYQRIYETQEDVSLVYSGYYPRQPQGMIGW